MLRLTLLGPPVVERDDRVLSFDTRKATALLAYLAVEAQPQPRDRIAAMLWPDADPNRARSALRRTLSVTAAQVGDVLVADRGQVSLATDQLQCDAVEFATLAARREATCDQRAAELWRDDFLAGFTLRDAPEFDDWHAAVSGELRRTLAAVLSRQVDDLVDRDELEAAVATAGRWLALDPMHEPAHRMLMQLHAWRGDRTGAIRQYRTCARILDRELGVPPLDETRELYDAIRRDAVTRPRPSRQQPSPPVEVPTPLDASLVGRGTEIAVVRQALSAAGDGHGSTVVVTGITGVGKTALLRAAAALAGDGVATVAVRCHPEEKDLAYGVAIELLRGLVVAVPASVDRLPRHSRSELARLLPELAELDAAAPRDDPGAEARLVAAARELVDAAATRVLLIVDDVQWLDSASANLLAYLTRRMSGLRAVLLCAWSSDADAPATLVRAVDDVVADGAGARMSLRPLDDEDLTALVHQSAAAVDVAVLRHATGGVPALAVAYLAAVSRGEDPVAGGATALRQTVARQLENMSESAQQLVAVVAVLGGHGDLDLLRETSGRGEDEIAAAVEEALAAGVLVELPGRDGYDVPFETMRTVVLDATTTIRRRLLHERAARTLERRARGAVTPAQCGVIARHLRAAGRDDDAAAWHWRAAAEARRLHAHAEALADIRAALELGHDPVDARLAEGEVLIALARYDDSITALELAAAGATAPAVAMQVDRRLGDVHNRLGQHDVADAHLAAALDAAESAGADDADVAMLLSERALTTYRRGDLAAATAFAAEAMARAQRCGDAAALATTTNALGMLAAGSGAHGDAERWMRASLEHADRSDDSAAAIAALNNLARVLHDTARDDEARDVARQALERGVRIGDRHRVAALHTNLADLLRAAGDTDAAMDHLKQAAALYAEVDDAAERRPEVWKYVEW